MEKKKKKKGKAACPTHRERPLEVGGGSLERHHDDGHPVHTPAHGQRLQVGQVDRHLAGKVVPLQAVVVKDTQQQDGAPRRQVLLGHVGAGRDSTGWMCVGVLGLVEKHRVDVCGCVGAGRDSTECVWVSVLGLVERAQSGCVGAGRDSTKWVCWSW